MALACMANDVPPEQIRFHEISVENNLVTLAADGALIPDVEKIKTALVEWLGE